MSGQFVRQVVGLKFPYHNVWYPALDAVFHVATSAKTSIQFSLANVRIQHRSGNAHYNGRVDMKLSLVGPDNGQIINADVSNAISADPTYSWVLNIAQLPPLLAPGHYAVAAQLLYASQSGSIGDYDLIVERAAIAVATR